MRWMFTAVLHAGNVCPRKINWGHTVNVTGAHSITAETLAIEANTPANIAFCFKGYGWLFSIFFLITTKYHVHSNQLWTDLLTSVVYVSKPDTHYLLPWPWSCAVDLCYPKSIKNTSMRLRYVTQASKGSLWRQVHHLSMSMRVHVD